jgi:alpha-ketoglutarate-dependent taurine dioxygenase
MQASPLPAKELATGQTRFQGWHVDGLLYGDNPSRVTALRCIKSPSGPDLTVRWDDGSGYTMKVKPGGTAFFSGYQLYDRLSSEERLLFDNSFWEAAPLPFLWTGSRKQRTTGIGFTDQGSVIAIEELPKWDPEKMQRYPMVWLNQVMGKKAIQIHPTCVRKFYLKTSRRGEERVVEDLEEIKQFLNRIIDRIAHPDYILVPPSNEGDVVVWNNWVGPHTTTTNYIHSKIKLSLTIRFWYVGSNTHRD